MAGKKRILVIEDEQNVCDLLKVNLELEGYEVEAALGGKKGLKKVESLDPELIILDIFMPKMDGWEVCRRLKADKKTKKIPVLMLTISSDRRKGLACGAEAFITKPFTMHDLIDQIKMLCPLDGD